MKTIAGMQASLPALFLGLVVGCTSQEDPQPIAAVSAELACSPTPYLAGVGLTDLAKMPVSSIQPNTDYMIEVCGQAPAVCLTLSAGGQLDPNTSLCHDMSFPGLAGGIGVTYYRVQPDGADILLVGQVTPWDGCDGEHPEAAMDFVLPPGTGCPMPVRRYLCGWAMPGYGCNNGRHSEPIAAQSMEAAIAACRARKPPRYPDSCYVLD